MTRKGWQLVNRRTGETFGTVETEKDSQIILATVRSLQPVERWDLLEIWEGPHGTLIGDPDVPEGEVYYMSADLIFRAVVNL